ncbi:MAG: hypothetical protein A2Z17_06885 [Gammaproteobacteria bacterium RBG_16_66_13]|nr:MAG: hypothetical protein A2Z17_06885 [Gammaproteobacteria bacterium RBG_16_66_13]
MSLQVIKQGAIISTEAYIAEEGCRLPPHLNRKSSLSLYQASQVPAKSGRNQCRIEPCSTL